MIAQIGRLRTRFHINIRLKNLNIGQVLKDPAKHRSGIAQRSFPFCHTFLTIGEGHYYRIEPWPARRLAGSWSTEILVITGRSSLCSSCGLCPYERRREGMWRASCRSPGHRPAVKRRRSTPRFSRKCASLHLPASEQLSIRTYLPVQAAHAWRNFPAISDNKLASLLLSTGLAK